MSEDYTDIEEARLLHSSASGQHTGMKAAERILRERAGEAFMSCDDKLAGILRKQAGTLCQEAELLAVQQQKRFEELRELETKGEPMTNEKFEQIKAHAERCSAIPSCDALELIADIRRLDKWPDYFAWEREMKKVQAENKRLREALEKQPVKGSFIGATHAHDAGAYGRCSYCLRYSDSPNCIDDRFRCDCGGVNGFSGSFKAPTHESKWCKALERSK